MKKLGEFKRKHLNVNTKKYLKELGPIKMQPECRLLIKTNMVDFEVDRQ